MCAIASFVALAFYVSELCVLYEILTKDFYVFCSNTFKMNTSVPEFENMQRSLPTECLQRRRDIYTDGPHGGDKRIETCLRSFFHEGRFLYDEILRSKFTCTSNRAHHFDRGEVSFETTGVGVSSLESSIRHLPNDFEELLIEMYSRFDDDVLYALVHIIHEYATKKDNNSRVYSMKCLEVLGCEHVDLVERIIANSDRVLFSLITDFLRLDVHSQRVIQNQNREKPSVYFSNKRKPSKEDKFMAKLLEKGCQLQTRETWNTLFTRGITDSCNAIPFGSQLRRFHRHIQLDVPPSHATEPDKNTLISVRETLPPWTHPVFGDINTLNPVQSKIFPAAFLRDENLLITAPTGCGKTLIAILVILGLVKLHLNTSSDEPNISAVKVVYLVPMKALASEVVSNFQKRFQSLNLKVRECTGDTSLTRQEVDGCNIIVSTPEKWDIITRKTADNTALSDFQLVIIDEIHLLNEDRGPVIEAIVARILMNQDVSGFSPRIIGLSATLPNAKDVASFIRANPESGVMVFEDRYRPVPLHKTYVGVKEKISKDDKNKTYSSILCDSVIKTLEQCKQVMIFVQARNQTLHIARHIREQMAQRGRSDLFKGTIFTSEIQKKIRRLKTSDLADLVTDSIGIHHAGMLRADRSLIEELFRQKKIQVLVCTATLAWGVNLPAHTVIIHGTEIYDAKKGGFIHLPPLDVLQIFGRAGRPGFDTSGHGIIITSDSQMQHYIRTLSQSGNIESHMLKDLANHLNAEIASGTVGSVNDAMKWMEYTYLWKRMQTNPFVYGVTVQQLRTHRNLYQYRYETITRAAQTLKAAKMVRFDEKTCSLNPTEIGRIASHYYIDCTSITIFNESLQNVKGEQVQVTDDEHLFAIISSCRDFQCLRIRPEEEDELHRLEQKLPFVMRQRNLSESCGSTQLKVILLLKFYLARLNPDLHSLTSDTLYIIDNVQRVCRALFEIEVHRQHPESALRLLSFAKCVERRCWESADHPIWQFQHEVPPYILERIENRMPPMDELLQMSGNEIGDMIQNKLYGGVLRKLLCYFPRVSLQVNVQPMTRSVLRVQARVTPQYVWSDRHHGTTDVWWLLVKDCDGSALVHSEYVSFSKAKVAQKVAMEVSFTIPLLDAHSCYEVVLENTSWIGAREHSSVFMKDIDLPDDENYTTKVVPIIPLRAYTIPKRFRSIYPYTYFNTVQSHCFHTLYHTREDVFLGAPTGSGKTVCAEFAILRVLQEAALGVSKGKVVYIAPLKALVRERVSDWKKRFQAKLGIGVVELTGDLTPSGRDLMKGTILCTTPEKWDGISRSWRQRKYVRDVVLLIIDEVHMVNSERGSTLEMIISRARVIGRTVVTNVRIIALSTAVANACDISNWLGVTKKSALFNFEPSVRPVPMHCFISGFPGRAYCPRMATMNKPIYTAIAEKSPVKPVIVFVSSRRQTRLTALALIQMLHTDDWPHRFVRMDPMEIQNVTQTIENTYLQYTIPFGIGIHHGGLCELDRHTTEKLFKAEKLQILVATSTLAWGVNFPAHMVIVKGTEFFDCKLRSYVDFPITDVLQMIGRAGRPQYDTEGVALVLTQDTKKEFYKRFLYNGFPVESFLHTAFIPHINAEIANRTIQSSSDMIDFFTRTFMFRRIIKNPVYYGIPDASNQSISLFLSDLVKLAVSELQYCFCLEETCANADNLQCTQFGQLCAYYYVSHQTMRRFLLNIKKESSPADMLRILSQAEEFAELPVRHNEDNFNIELAKIVPLDIGMTPIDSPHTKAHLLLQAHFTRCPLPVSDYKTDTRTAIDSSARIVQAMIDVAACQGFLKAVSNVTLIWKAISSRRWWSDQTLLQIPHCTVEMLWAFARCKLVQISDIMPLTESTRRSLKAILGESAYDLTQEEVRESMSWVETLPVLDVSLTLEEGDSYCLKVHIHSKRTHSSKRGQNDQFCAVLGDDRTGDLIAIKHIHRIQGAAHFELNFDADEEWSAYAGQNKESYYPLQFRLICGSYFGLDIVKDVHISMPRHSPN